MAQTRTHKTCDEWRDECNYISQATTDALSGRPSQIRRGLENFNNDRACFVRYCEMQRNCATSDGRHDSAQYIQHCIDDLTD